MKKAIILLGLLILVGCGVPSPCVVGQQNETHFCNEYHNWERKHIDQDLFGGVNTTETNISFKIMAFNESTPSIAFSDSQIQIENMDCYPISCPSNLCLECRTGNESVNFTEWFNP